MMPKQKKKTPNKTLKKVDSVLIHIANLKCDVDVNQDVYSKEDKKRLKGIVDKMSKNIWIDKTYVAFKGNRWKDAFIKEEGWNELLELIGRTNFGRKVTKSENEELVSAMLAIAITYLYDIAIKYDFDVEYISIDFKINCKFWAEYLEDNSKDWRF